MTVVVTILLTILIVSIGAIMVGFNDLEDRVFFGGIIGAFLSFIALVVIGITASAQYQHEQRELCESKGGTYITGKGVDPVCVKSDQTINLGN